MSNLRLSGTGPFQPSSLVPPAAQDFRGFPSDPRGRGGSKVSGLSPTNRRPSRNSRNALKKDLFPQVSNSSRSAL